MNNLETIAKDLYLMGCNVLINEPMSKHTTFRIGGKVALYVTPKTKNIFIEVLNYLDKNNIEYKIIGGGANLIVSDKFHDFVVISTEYISGYEIENEKIIAESGIPLSRLSFIAMENSLSGMEFACGIPGSLGGAIFMNAGAYGGEMKNIIETVEVYDLKSKKILFLGNSSCKFGYRTSIFQKNNLIILGATIALKKGIHEKIKQEIFNLLEKRWSKQPLEYPSAGSIFKRPEPTFYVGTTIEKLNLKGFSIGGAQISEKHGGFIINKENATFEDVQQLINHVKKIVKEKYNKDLKVEPEIWE
ncbi:UDP-N-acetylenolpyruvoylglucosamine reductase [Marinitoga sp. 1135]|uniref:UDP-N-acetylmuramate dehydrogenase n=1 Tax=Marinitoga sp. 1135 TaxID=1643333 RepID=UPI00158692A0|nr:UDP-N-acetylmuramate dehydrogenase [Marinitoga sp. 1135]NUU95044.1 UDP-N-acetylenolpyruvoylglucosamine reductase [Marinitoga sp. 1135]